ncbi:hypothetical protein [Chloroflexus sp.]|uniref:hypothetical protein n=1 Tax=Chloroflexus sp. TaxID=1904827 RepID=UPI003C7228C0
MLLLVWHLGVSLIDATAWVVGPSPTSIPINALLGWRSVTHPLPAGLAAATAI